MKARLLVMALERFQIAARKMPFDPDFVLRLAEILLAHSKLQVSSFNTKRDSVFVVRASQKKPQNRYYRLTLFLLV